MSFSFNIFSAAVFEIDTLAMETSLITLKRARLERRWKLDIIRVALHPLGRLRQTMRDENERQFYLVEYMQVRGHGALLQCLQVSVDNMFLVSLSSAL